jgi:hypothetical protein
MYKNLITLLAAPCILFFGCSKSKQSDVHTNPPVPVKIELVSGSGQADTIGKLLTDLIVVKVTKNGSPLSGYKVQYQGSGCNDDRLDQFMTKPDGTAADGWFLGGDVGQQTPQNLRFRFSEHQGRFCYCYQYRFIARTGLACFGLFSSRWIPI